jgi:hypothetical protein
MMAVYCFRYLESGHLHDGKVEAKNDSDLNDAFKKFFAAKPDGRILCGSIRKPGCWPSYGNGGGVAVMVETIQHVHDDWVKDSLFAGFIEEPAD